MRSDGDAAADRSRPWHVAAFGLTLEAPFRFHELPSRPGYAEGDVTHLSRVSTAELEANWSHATSIRILEESSEPARTVDQHDRDGYRLWALGYGTAHISADGRCVRCAPDGSDADWRWQRFLTGWVLPWTSLVRGFEVLHASATAISGRAIALVGPSGSGKTSLAVHLTLGGAGFMTDDVLAVSEASDGRIWAHPGSGTAGIRAEERVRLTTGQVHRLGEMPIRDDKSYPTLARIDSPLPLGAVYFITRHPAGAREAIQTLPDVDLTLLLASTFVPNLQTPRRLVNALDICSAVKRTVPTFQVRVQADTHAAALAQQLHAHVHRLLAAG